VQPERDDPYQTTAGSEPSPASSPECSEGSSPRERAGMRLTTPTSDDMSDDEKTPLAERNGHIPRPVYTTRREVESLGVSLGPALHDACGDRLGDIEWFQSPWQKSGAATGRTYWRLPNGRVIDAIVKVPVGYREYYWSTRLGEVDPMWWESSECERLPVPRMLASGTELGGYDVAWLVEEKVAGKPVSRNLDADSLEQVFLAAARFHAHTREIRPAERSERAGEPDWRKLLDRSRTRCRDNEIAEMDDWLRAIDGVDRVLPALVDRWHTRPMDTWCHGDLHPGNVMLREGCMQATSRANASDRRCGVLIDFSLVHPGHWVEDALYLERMYWGREDRLQGVEPLRCLAEHRLLLGLHADGVDDELADVRRLLMGVTSPAFLNHENDPVYLAAALAKIREILPCFGVSL
jgi:hypothetical protein